jgi:hypothetical protein
MVDHIVPILVLAFIICAFSVVLLPPLVFHVQFRSRFQSNANNPDVAKEIVKNEVCEELRGNYYIVVGKTAPMAFYGVLGNEEYKAKLAGKKIKIIVGKELKCEGEQDKEAFKAFLKDKNVECFLFLEGKTPRHFRICDNRYAYVEMAHRDSDTTRPYSIYREEKVVSAYIDIFNKISDDASGKTKRLESADIDSESLIRWQLQSSSPVTIQRGA